MWNPFNKRADIPRLGDLTKESITELEHFVGSEIHFEKNMLAAIPVAAVLQGLTTLSRGQPHNTITNYYSIAQHVFLKDETAIQAVETFVDALRADIARLSAPNWLPWALADEVFAGVFGMDKQLMAQKGNDEHAKASVKSYGIATACFSIYNQVIHYKL